MFNDWEGPRGPFARDMGRWAREFSRDFSRQFNRGWARREHFRDRVFGRGDLKYVILDMLRDRSRHGYDIIRELESRFGGFYTPSAGVVYPTLQMLEDMGAVTSEQQEGRKMYTITDEGRRILDERRDTIDDIADRVRNWMHGATRPELQQTMGEMGDLMSLLGRNGPQLWNDPEKLKAVRDVIARTRAELEGILTSTRL
ncbi:MAG: PadR family transcriptional regulator [Candidatus Eremiobacteraeota bacterium]|nr:PadR family transcriptional regulator [Candidatus Eremiobacteraeota bacterium]